MNSRCSRCALLTSAIVGAAIAASRAISPGWFMPSSTTAGAVPVAQAQQRQRHADVVVEVAFGRERGVAEPGAKDRRDHLRHRRLAVAAGDRDQRQREAPPPRRGELAERALAVGDLEAGQSRRVEAALGERGDGAAGLRVGQKVVRVEALAAQARRTGRPGATLRVSLCTRAIGVVTLPTTRAPGSIRAASSSVIIGVAGPASRSRARASASAAWRASENGNFAPPMSW